MSEKERENFFKGAVSREPGKRQVKPSVALFESAFEQAAASMESDDDEDFTAQNCSDQSSSGESASDGRSTDGYESDSESEDESQKSSDERQSADGMKSDYAAALKAACKKSSHMNGLLISEENLQAIGHICSICLNLLATNDACGELIQCDKCGLFVHEWCYGVSNDANHQADGQSQTSSTATSTSTEPWFCEPCLFGDGNVPHCELCPSRFGAFKKGDVAGTWVHLICALFTAGIEFTDAEHLSGISWRNIDYRQFGRKPCSGCTDQIESRTGITIQCDAGLCKTHYHVTCAQRLGLLVEYGPQLNHHHSSTTPNNNNSSESGYLYCKRHNHNESAVYRQKNAYARFVSQEEMRMVKFKHVQLDDRQEKKWQAQLEGRMKYSELNAINSQHEVLQQQQQKKAKFLHTSAKYLNAFAEKAELLGLTRQQFQEEFATVPASQLPIGLPPAFSKAFVGYVEHRDTILISEEEQKLQASLQIREQLLSNQANLEQELSQVKAREEEMKKRCDAQNKLFEKFKSALKTLSPSIFDHAEAKKKNADRKRSMAMPPKLEEKHRKWATSPTAIVVGDGPMSNLVEEKQPSKKCQKSPASQIAAVSPPTIAQTEISSCIHQNNPNIPHSLFSKFGTNDKQQTNFSPLDATKTQPKNNPLKKTKSLSASYSNVPMKESLERSPKECNKCKKTSDLHLLIFCETCKQHFHIGCLDPPLDRMPTRDKFSRFECSDCADAIEEKQKVRIDEQNGIIVKAPPPEDWSLATMRERRRPSRMH